MAGSNNTTRIDEIVDPVAIEQFNALKASGKELRTELSALLETAIKLNTTLGGSTPASFAKNLKASTDATEKIIANNNKQIENEQKKIAKQEEIVNKYLILLSKQEAARQQQQAKQDILDAKEIQKAEAKAAKLQAISDKAEAERVRKASVQFPAGSSLGGNPVTQEPSNPTPAYQPIITGNEDMRISAARSTEALQAESLAMAEQKEVVDSLSVSYRANIELLLELQVERAANIAELKELNVQDSASGERAVFLTAEQLRLKTAIAQTNATLAQQTTQMLAEDTSLVQMKANVAELTAAYNNLAVVERENIEIGGVLIAEIERLNIAIQQGAISTQTYSTATVLAEKVTAQFTRQLVRMAAQFLLITVIFGAITWLYDYIKGLDIFTGRLDQATQNLKAINEVQKNAANNAGELVGKYRILSDTVKDLTVSYDDRFRAATELKKLFPVELEHSTAQAIANGTEAESLDKLTESVVKLAKAKAAATEIEKTEGEIIALQIQRDKVNSAKSSNLDATNKGNGYGRLSFFQQLTVSQSGVPSKDDLKKIFKNDADVANSDIAAQIKIKEQTIKLLEQYGGLANEAEAVESKSTLNPKKPKGNDHANTDLLEYQRLKIEESKKTAKAIIDNEKQSYDARLLAISVYTKKSNELIDNAEKIALADTNLRAQQRKNIILKFENERKDIANETAAQREQIDKQELAKHEKLLKDTVTLQKEAQQEQIEDLEQGAIVAAQVLQNARDKALDAKNDEYDKGLISEKKYNRDLLSINDQYAIDRLNQELVVQQSILAIKKATRDKELAAATANGATPEELSKITSDNNKGINGTNNTIAKLQADIANATNKKKRDDTNGNQGDGKDKRKQFQDTAGYAIDVINDVKELTDGLYESEISKLEKIGEKIQENAQLEHDAIDRSLDTQANKARRQQILDAQTASQQKALQQKIADEKTKQARADKAAAIAEIILNTAIGASKVVGQFGVFGLSLVPIVIALGALQLAKVIATPIPQFAKGGTTKGGLVIYGEKGPELVEEPGRQPYYSPGVATMANLPSGTKITANNMLPKTPNWESSRTDNRDVVEAIDRLARKDQPKQRQPKLTNWVESQRQADAWGRYAANHFK